MADLQISDHGQVIYSNVENVAHSNIDRYLYRLTERRSRLNRYQFIYKTIISQTSAGLRSQLYIHNADRNLRSTNEIILLIL